MNNGILFVLKRREDFDSKIHNVMGLSTGLFNSANYINEMLLNNNISSNMVVVVDNNDIDREVTKHKPKLVIIEALWVVPSKFTVLQKLHPNVTWIIRLHSDMPFMSNEGMAMDWLGDYSDNSNILIACNSPRMLNETRQYLKLRNNWTFEQTERKVIFLPNYYSPTFTQPKEFNYNKDYIDISCFGAVRPLKNHLLQAHAALQFATDLGKKLKFHVNSGRIEMKGSPVVNNLRGLFQQIAHTGHELISHAWMQQSEFLALCSTMDIGLQVSFSETFNIVAADHISQGVPIIGSTEIPWLNIAYCANPVYTKDIVKKLHETYSDPLANVSNNQANLTKYLSYILLAWKQQLSI